MSKVKPIPDGVHTVTPYLILKGGAQAIDFYKRAFGAQERLRFPGLDGKTIGHAELLIGDSIVMMSDECPERGSQSPKTLKGSPVGFVITVEDADAAFKKAVAAGATVKEPMENKFYGARAGTVTDPFGFSWTLMTFVEEVPMEEMKRRMDKMTAEMAQKKGA